MIDIQQYRVVVGIFNIRVYIGSKSKCNWYGKNGLLFEIIALIIDFLILLCGDIEENPAPRGYKVCPQCKTSIVVSIRLCSCGYRFNKKACHTNSSSKSTGRPVGTTHSAGFNVSDGRPLGTTHEKGATSSLIEDNESELMEHMKQYYLPITWNTSVDCLSLKLMMTC